MARDARVRRQLSRTVPFDDLVRAADPRRPTGVRRSGCGSPAGGAFPNPGRARVLWAGLEADEHAAPSSTGWPPARARPRPRPVPAPRAAGSRPHLTLARLGRPAEVSSWVRLLDGYDGPPWTVEGFALIASHLGEGPRKRPRYELVDTFTLGA